MDYAYQISLYRRNAQFKTAELKSFNGLSYAVICNDGCMANQSDNLNIQILQLTKTNNRYVAQVSIPVTLVSNTGIFYD